MSRNFGNNFNQSYRRLIFKKTSGYCYYCGVQLLFDYWGEPNSFCVDHVVSKCRGGSDDFENLVASCRTCNLSKKDRSIEEFRQYLQWRSLGVDERFTESQKQFLRKHGFDIDSVIVGPQHTFYFELEGKP